MNRGAMYERIARLEAMIAVLSGNIKEADVMYSALMCRNCNCRIVPDTGFPLQAGQEILRCDPQCSENGKTVDQRVVELTEVWDYGLVRKRPYNKKAYYTWRPKHL